MAVEENNLKLVSNNSEQEQAEERVGRLIIRGIRLILVLMLPI